MQTTPELSFEQTYSSTDARALVKVGCEVLYNGRPDLAVMLFERANHYDD